MSFAEKMFDIIDDDKSGEISKEEMLAIFEKFDKDGGGTVDLNEWIDGFTGAFGGTKEQATKAFKAIDEDGSGEIEIAEVEAIFKKMDADGSGSVDKKEFVDVFGKLV